MTDPTAPQATASRPSGWKSARGHVVFLLALVTAFAVVWWLERWETGAGDSTAFAWEPDLDAPRPPPPLEPLGEAEMESARAAWAYFEANIRPETGLVDSVAGFPSTTMWDTGSFLIAAVAAERLGVLRPEAFDRVVAPALDSLARMPLFDGRLPNKAYDTTTLSMTTYANQATEEGIGWSALDIARVLVALHTILRDHPRHAAAVEGVLEAWDLGAAVRDGVLIGARPSPGGVELVQEGRLGYEQYGARGFALFGFDTGEAGRVETHLDWLEVQGVEVPQDRRDPEELGAHSYMASDPFLLSVLEYGWDTRLSDLAWRIYLAQERRHAETGVLTAVTEDHLDRAPYFVYSTVAANGEPWAVLNDQGGPVRDVRTLSAKAALGWGALYATPYTDELARAVAGLRTPGGWQAGLYEATEQPNTVLSANTNAVILEALHWRVFGPIVTPDRSAAELSPDPASGPEEP